VEIGPWTRKDAANLKWLSITDLGGYGRLFVVFGGRVKSDDYYSPVVPIRNYQ
jgi:hypothetical protein